MTVKNQFIYENQIFMEIVSYMDKAAFGRVSAEQMLKKLCGMLGEGVECIVSLTVKGRENFLFTTIPEDEAQYYKYASEEEIRTERTMGIRSLQTGLEVKGILEGFWVLEVSEHIPEKEILSYQNIVSVMKAFLYNCFLAQECDRRAQRDCFTGLPGCRFFEEDLYKMLSEKEQGYLIVVRGSVQPPKPYRENGINSAMVKIADASVGIHPDGVYRIGPDMVAVLCREGKEETWAVLQELMWVLPESVFFLSPLAGLDAGSVYKVIQNGLDGADWGEIVFNGSKVFPKLPFFREGLWEGL